MHFVGQARSRQDTACQDLPSPTARSAELAHTTRVRVLLQPQSVLSVGRASIKLVWVSLRSLRARSVIQARTKQAWGLLARLIARDAVLARTRQAAA